MLAILAHELRNPLATIRSGLKILEISSSKEQTAKARMMMERQLAYVIRLVNEVLDLSRLHEGRLSLHKEPIVLGDVINLALETSSASLKNGKHSVSVAIPDVAVALRGDSTRLAQALSNLLDNASKYTPEGGAVSLAAMLDGTEVVIQVSDTGLGIPADRLDHIFTLFSQIDGHRGYSRGGLGIGLFLVKAIVEGHGGSVRAESLGEGKGAVFTMRLPLGEDV
jgi:signal transduction histidine kinase